MSLYYYRDCVCFASDINVGRINTLKTRRMDEGALNGLRGLLAFHIMVHHLLAGPSQFFAGSNFYLYIYGPLDISLFFLLSGFCLALSYGRTHWTSVSICCSKFKGANSHEINYLETCGDDQSIFDSVEFYKKRLIRIIPLHYLGILAACISR